MSSEGTDKKTVRRHRSDEVDYSTYVHKLLKSVAPSKNLSKGARTEINQSLIYIGERLVEACRSILRVQDKVTVAPATVTGACRIVLRSLAGDVVKAVDEALVRYDNGVDVKSDRRQRIEARAGLVFSVSRTRHLMKLGLCGRISKRSTIAMTASLEAVARHMLLASQQVADDMKKAIISTRHLRLAIGSDQSLADLFTHVIFAGGVMPAEQPVRRKAPAKSTKTTVQKKVPVATKGKKALAKSTKAEAPATQSPAKETTKPVAKRGPPVRKPAVKPRVQQARK